MRPVTRRERRAERQRRYAAAREVRLTPGLEYRVSGWDGASRAIDYEAPLSGWLRSLDYSVSGETGALVAHTHSLSWHRAKSPNIAAPPLGRGWDGSGPVRVVGVDAANAPKQGIHLLRGKHVAETATEETTE